MMKKTLVAIAALAVVSAASAQVTLSGAIGIDYGKRSTGVAGLENSDAGATNFAIKSVEDLGGGLKLTAYLQPRFASNSGANINTAGKGVQNVYLNVAGNFGSVSVGRILTGNQGDAFSQYGNSGDYGDIDNTGNRHDNVVAYYSPTYMGFSANVSGTVNPGTTAENQYVQIKYANGPIAASYAQDKNAGNVAGATYRTIAGSYDMKTVKLIVTNGDTEVPGTTTLNSTSIGVQVPMGAATVKAMGVTGDVSAYVFGVDYALSKRTGLFADFANTDGAVSSAYRIGMRTSF